MYSKYGLGDPSRNTMSFGERIYILSVDVVMFVPHPSPIL